MQDVLIVGAGVIGLSLAYELSLRGQRVSVLERGEPGQEASWAGAGILPPGNRQAARTAWEQLAGLSAELHVEWAERLKSATGIDTGYRRCGGLYLALQHADAQRTQAELAVLDLVHRDWQQQHVRCDLLTAEAARSLEPALDSRAIAAAIHLPDECQLRNPHHLRALIAAVTARGVVIERGVTVTGCQRSGDRITALETSTGLRTGGQYVFNAGAWTRILAETCGLALALEPIRGQIVLVATASPVIRKVINHGKRYLVPRCDGRLLIGATEERVGFVKANTPDAVMSLMEFAERLVPALGKARFERAWSGLRPGTADGLPYLGRAPGLENLYIASGHFRSGLQLSPATAVVMSQCLLGEKTEVDLTEFRLERGT